MDSAVVVPFVPLLSRTLPSSLRCIHQRRTRVLRIQAKDVSYPFPPTSTPFFTSSTMANRFFPNTLPPFIEESDSAVADEPSLLKLLRLPYPLASQKFLRAAVDIKNKVVRETWVRAGRRVSDPTLYTGALGTALLLFKSYKVTGDRSDLDLCSEIVGACDAASRGMRYVSFICGRAGVCALGAVVAKVAGDEVLLDRYLRSFYEIRIPDGVPNELLYGRSGYLWACFFINKHIGEGTIPSEHTGKIAMDVLRDGKTLAKRSSCPLMYEWHGKKYWGAAHGLTGIMHVLMDTDLKPEDEVCVKGTLRYMIQNRFPSGNYPSSEDSEGDRLVHWCHGAPGVSLTLTKASQVFKDENFLKSAAEAAEVVWSRGLLRRVGICHGVSGNAYVFLSLYRRTGNKEYLYRAKAFASFLLHEGEQLIADGKMHGGDHPFSLFEGQAGMAYLFFDMVNPSDARFPGYEL